MNLGSHMSISGGVHKAIERGASIGCTCIQIFTKSSNQWKSRPYSEEEMLKFASLKKQENIDPIVAHASYLINLASPDDLLFKKSVDSFFEEMERCDKLFIPYIIIHPGSHVGSGEKNGIARIAEALNTLHKLGKSLKVEIALETTAGQGTNLGYSFEQLAEIIERVSEKEKLWVCLDTCHIFAAGYDIRTQKAYNETIKRFDEIVGIKKIKAIHINDAKKGLGSKLDRHEHIGKGEIGLEGFKNIINDKRFDRIPLILETPKDEEMEWDKMNLAILKKLKGT